MSTTVAVEMVMVAVMLAPFIAALSRLPAYLAERRGIEAYDVAEGAGELVVVAKRRSHRTTKSSLLRLGSEAAIESARRVLVVSREAARAAATARRVEVLQLADIRRSVRNVGRKTERKTA